jgi:DNA-binding XRE family transcriptional regulator
MGEQVLQHKFALAKEINSRYRIAMKQISEYLTSTKTTRAALAAQVGIAKSTMTEIMQGKYPPPLRVAFAIEDATGGAVPARSWLDT